MRGDMRGEMIRYVGVEGNWYKSSNCCCNLLAFCYIYFHAFCIQLWYLMGIQRLLCNNFQTFFWTIYFDQPPYPQTETFYADWKWYLNWHFFCCQCNDMKQAKLHSSFLFSAIKVFTRRSYITWTALLWVGLLIVSLWCSLQSSPDLPIVLTPVVLLTPITVMHRRAWLRLLWMFILVAPVDLFSWPRTNTCTEVTCTPRVILK